MFSYSSGCYLTVNELFPYLLLIRVNLWNACIIPISILYWTFLNISGHVWTCFLSHTVCSSAVNEMFPWQASIKELETLSTNTKTHQKLWVNMFKHVWTCFLSHAAVNEMFSWQASIKELETLSTNTKTHQKVVGGHKASQII